MSRKHTKRRARPGMHPLDAITASQPFPPAELTRILIKVNAAFDHLCSGGSDVDQFDRLAAVLNVGMVRCEQIGSPPDPERNTGAATFIRAQHALMEADSLYGRQNRYGFTGPGLQAMREALQLYDEILRASTPLQMATAQEECMRRVRAGQFEQAHASTQAGSAA